VEETWTSSDLPVLEAVVHAKDARFLDPEILTGADIASATGLDEEDVGRSLLRLKDEYIELRRVPGRPSNWLIQDVTPAARRVVGQWPSPDALVDRFIGALNAAADQEADPERQSKFRQASAFVGGIARDIFVEVAAAVITGRTGIAGHGPGPSGG